MLDKIQFFLQTINGINRLYHTIITIAVFILFLISCGAVFFGMHGFQTICIVLIHLILFFITLFFINQKQKRQPLPSPTDMTRLRFFLVFSVMSMILFEAPAIHTFIFGYAHTFFLPIWLETITLYLWLFLSGKINAGIYLSHQKENRFNFTHQDNQTLFNTGIFLILLFFLLTTFIMPVFGAVGIFSVETFSILITLCSFIILISYIFFLTFAVQYQNEFKTADIIITVIFGLVCILGTWCFYMKHYIEFISIVLVLLFLIWCGWARLKEKQMMDHTDFQNHVRFVSTSMVILLLAVFYLTLWYVDDHGAFLDVIFNQWLLPAVMPVFMMYIMHTSFEYYCIENTYIENNKKTNLPMIFTAVSGLFAVCFHLFFYSYIGIAASVLLLGVLVYQYVSMKRIPKEKSVPVIKPLNVPVHIGKISSYISYICFILCMILPFSHYYFGNTAFHRYFLDIIYIICFGNILYSIYKKINEYRPLKTGTIVKTVLFILFSLPLLLFFTYDVITVVYKEGIVFPLWFMYIMLPFVLFSIYMFFGLFIQKTGITYSTHRIMFVITIFMTLLFFAISFTAEWPYRFIIYIFCIITVSYMVFLSYTSLRTIVPEYKLLHYLIPSLILIFPFLFYFGILTPAIKFIISLIIPFGWGVALYFDAKGNKQAKEIGEITAFSCGVLLFLANVIVLHLSAYGIIGGDSMESLYSDHRFYIYMAFPICLMTVIAKGIEFLLTQELTEKTSDFSLINEDALLTSYIVFTGLFCIVCSFGLFKILTVIMISLEWILILSIFLFWYRKAKIDRREKEIQQALKKEENKW